MTSDPFCATDPQPEDYFEYYGFSQYARELNELTPELEDVLPPTDSRFRPDQRCVPTPDFIFQPRINVTCLENVKPAEPLGCLDSGQHVEL